MKHSSRSHWCWGFEDHVEDTELELLVYLDKRFYLLWENKYKYYLHRQWSFDLVVQHDLSLCIHNHHHLLGVAPSTGRTLLRCSRHSTCGNDNAVIIKLLWFQEFQVINQINFQNKSVCGTNENKLVFWNFVTILKTIFFYKTINPQFNRIEHFSNQLSNMWRQKRLRPWGYTCEPPSCRTCVSSWFYSPCSSHSLCRAHWREKWKYVEYM